MVRVLQVLAANNFREPGAARLDGSGACIDDHSSRRRHGASAGGAGEGDIPLSSNVASASSDNDRGKEESRRDVDARGGEGVKGKGEKSGPGGVQPGGVAGGEMRGTEGVGVGARDERSKGAMVTSAAEVAALFRDEKEVGDAVAEGGSSSALAPGGKGKIPVGSGATSAAADGKIEGALGKRTEGGSPCKSGDSDGDRYLRLAANHVTAFLRTAFLLIQVCMGREEQEEGEDRSAGRMGVGAGVDKAGLGVPSEDTFKGLCSFFGFPDSAEAFLSDRTAVNTARK